MRAQELSGCHPWWIVDSASSVGGLGRHKKKKKKTLKRRVFVVGVIFAVLQLLSNKVSGVEALGNHRNHHQLHRTNSNSEIDDDLNLDDSEVVRFLSHPVHQSSHDADSFSSNHANRIRRQDTFYEEYSSGDYEFETPGDDEDYVDRGSGFVESDISVRILIIIEEPWNKFLLDVNSSAHRQLARRIQGGFDGYYGDIEGNQMVQVRRFAPTTRSEILAILDMVISENPNVNESKDILEQRLREGRIGDLAIVEGGPSWWRLMDSPGFSSSECTSFEVFCPSGECVGADRICDGIRDCLDASDELKCSEQCNFDQHECDYGHCIEKKLICDGKVDCPSDNSDERNCPNANIIPSPSPQPVGCRADTQIACPGSNTRICEIHKCDGNEDCPKDPSSTSKSWDEVDCPDYSNITFETPTEEEQKLTFFVTVTPKLQIVPVGSTITLDCSVEPNDFLGTRVPSLDWNREEDSMPLNRITLGPLGTSMQISNIKKSDAGTYTCSGMATLNEVLVKKSDESVLQIKLCESDEFSCETGECLRNYERCNYVKDCPGGEDELNCPCRSPDLLCGDGSTCIESGKVCDGFRDCPTGEDESSCEPECDGFVCQSDSKCIPSYQVCDYILDCDDKSDEINCACDMTTQFPCDPTNPPGGKCLPLDMKCDSYPDCPDGRDEDDCPITTCRPDQFTCESNPFDGAICISIDLQCNGQSDCYNGEDERGCPTPTCPPDQFSCDSNSFSDTLCISMDLRCNGQSDCYNGEDERGCPTPTCPPDQFSCDSNSFSDTLCISMDLRCNGQSDCYNGEDEQGCPTPTCSPDQFTCDSNPFSDTLCISMDLRCNGQSDCYNGEDEQGCPTPTCPPDQFTCDSNSFSDTLCISMDLRCNGQSDCYNGEDEQGCPTPTCPPDQFTCDSNSFSDTLCISMDLKCDGKSDCDSGEDEKDCPLVCLANEVKCLDAEICAIPCNNFMECPMGEDELNCQITTTPLPPTPPPTPACRPNEFECRDGSCISVDFVCNLEYDCVDGSDEDPNKCACDPPNFQCTSGRCLDQSRVCDSINDCDDGVDEFNCIEECQSGQFQCGNGLCVDGSKICDGIYDCVDAADERDCALCRPYEFRCESGDCVDSRLRCNGFVDCTDGTDELDCPFGCSTSEFQCSSGRPQCIDNRRKCDNFRDCQDGSDEENCGCRDYEFQCRSGQCVEASRKCDRYSDCQDGSDEIDCGCQDYEFQCRSGQCIEGSRKCDRYSDCQDGSDEDGCPVYCRLGEFTCANGQQCILERYRCNDRYDCNDGSDEQGCQPTETLNLRTYPTEQTIKEGREVVFQCRDESPLRARVQWTRGNGLAFPPGSRDANGRLEMPNIQITHTGTYVCEAIDYVGQYGSTISVYLRVIEQERPPALPSRTCGPAEATCANGDCVLKSLVCDGNFDCADGSDERNCRGGDGCEPNEFQCDNKRCVLKTWRCDSDDDCGDQSDETFCATNPPGSPCKYHEWMCQSGDQCIPKSFHCDSEMDCQDQSDEIGCTPPIIIESPPPQVIVDPSFTFVINCTAMGIPTPEIVWRLNWGHVPDKCSMTSTPEGGNRAYGELTCPDAMEMDQGAYSCEAINSKGSCFAGSPGCGQPGQDAIVLLRRPDGICSPGKFNTNAMSEGECLSCFCFGITEECSSAELYLTETRIPNNGYILVGVSVNPSGVPSIETNIQGRDLLKSTRAGQIAFSQDTRSFGSNTPFFKLPIDGNQLKSYGAYLSLNLRYSGNGDPTQAPTIILIGNDLTLMYIVPSNELKANEANSLKIRFWEGLWYKRAYPNGQGVQGGEPATRNEIMMALQNVQHLLVKGQYLSDIVDTTIESLQLGSAENQDQGLGPATLVEQCRCPKGYMGLSCEECAPDYERVQEGPWKGMCRQPVASCPPGYYGDPSSGIECQVCPCPLQSPSNQFGRECYLDFDKEVTCRCPMGYEGRRCDQCAPGYSGNPTLPGDFCKPEIVIKPPSLGCESNRRLECFDGELICEEKRCDFVIDCSQGEDEQNCGNDESNAQCSEANWMFCLNGQPFCPGQRCDGIRDCPDARDEQGCFFSEGPEGPRFNSFPAVPPTYPPERPNNPSYNQDEACRANEYTCLDGTCIPKYLRCNGVANCKDLSDEVGCQPCREGQFQCLSSSKCVPLTAICNGTEDCQDGSDERDCTQDCKNDEFRCSDGTCIRDTHHCDGVLHCADFSDERDCPVKCQDNQFLCNSGICIPLSGKCDGVIQCPSGEDEANCPSKVCNENEFQCSSGKCINSKLRCDEFMDCQDGSDEENCQIQCSPNDDFFCSDGTCVPKAAVCNGVNECVDGSDENGCLVRCQPQEIPCDDGTCIPLWMKCNGRMECLDGSDEKNCANCSPESEFDCGNGICIGLFQKCDGKADCPNRSDEQDCTPTPCKATEFQCDNGLCLNKSFRCDRVYDCSDGSDEFGCPVTCKLDEFQCKDQSCIPEWLRCDGSRHCKDGSDEVSCSVTNLCSSGGGFICDGKCLNASHRCDGQPDCRSGLDEINCSSVDTIPKFACCDGTQIPAVLQCNNVVDCPDGSDEFYCIESLPICNIGEFSCSDGRCLPLKLRCNGVNDCSDGSDEACGCSDYCRGEDYFLCEDNLCLSINPGESIACDGVQQCIDGSDEKSCFAGPSQSCNYPGGSYAPTPDPNTGRCQCQPGYVGNFCDRYDPSGQFPPPSQPSTPLCQEDEFWSLEENSCINCFCMGIPQTNGQPTQCQGSNLYRDKERAVFSDDDSLGFVLSTEFPDEPPITDVFVDLDSNELVYQPTTREKLFWKLPAQFIGNKLASYGGILQFHLGNTPEISQESILEAPLVEIQGNDIRLLHYTNAPVGPNDPFVVKFIENQWQRQDGQRTGREHLLMALANLDHILIRATFGEGLEDIRIGNVTMDVAGGRDTGLQRASSVEQCLCPPGYKGLSCEKCSPGYTRSTEGLYLGLCQPCQCYGYANTCDPDNGVCVGCRDGTTGAYCDRCEEGYDGDPTRGIPCTRSSEGPLTCSCDSRGSLSQECDNYQCDCKANVEGTNCNRCKSGTFDLDASNPIGCSECWCAGVTDECFEAPLYWSTLRMIPTDSQHGVTLKDMSRRENFSRNLQYGNGVIGYQYASKSDQPLYWSLPAQFIGNKVESYGGNLTIHQKFGGNGAPLDLANVIMVGNGVALHWKDPNQSRWTPDEKMETVLNLREPDWIRVQGGVPSEATKDDFLTALSNLDVILIRATLLEYTSSTSLHKVMMDIAVQQATGFPSNGIEECQCPVGYQGNSCQECAVGHYRDPSDRSEGSLGKCKPCQCNGNEQECSLDIDGILQCTCQPGYSGPRCESVDEQARPPYQPYPSQPTRPPYQQPPTRPPYQPPTRPPYQPPTRPPYQPPTRPPYQPPETTRPPYRPPQNTPPIEVTITGPKIQIIEVGQTIQFQCNANNRFQNTPVDISWSKADGSLPYGRYNDNQRGLLVITGIQVSDQGTYVCTATDGVYTMTDETVLTVDGNNGPPPGKPTVRTEPRYIYSNEGESAQFICIAEGNPIPSISWKPGRGSLNNAEVRGQTLSFNRVQKSDEGDYFCVASNDYGETEERVFLYVEEREYISPSIPTLPPAPQPQPRPPYGTPPIQISPQSYSGNPGETIRLDCRASQPGYSISWSKQEGRLPYSATQENGVLIIPNPSVSDSGVYICMASNQSGVRQESQAVITIQAYPSEPVPYNPNEPQQELRIAPEQQTVPQGTIATLRCNGARGNIVWTKVPDEDLSQNPNVQISGNTLTIRNPQVSDRGVYVCTVTGPNGMDRSSAILEIERRESPQIEIYPQPAQRINTGQSVLFQCRVMAGIPMPTLTWSRSDGRQMQPNVEVLEGGVLRIMNVVGPERGEYKCLAENLAGRVERIATLVIQEPPEITMNPDNSIQINVGDQKRITCTAKGNPLPRITWEKINQGPIQAPTSPTSSDTVSSTYMIPRASREDQGSYLCKAVSEAGEAQGMVQLIVLEVGVPAGPYQPQPEYGRPDYGRPEERPDYGRPDERPDYGRPDERPDYGRPDYNQEGGRPDYEQQGGVEVSQKQFDAPLGGNAELRCFVVGNMAGIQAQWIRPNNQRLPSGSYERGGTLYLRDLMREDGGQYTCQAVDPSGRVLFRATTNLQVTAPPRIILDPAKQVVNPGDDARIACVATGDQPINIRWTKQNGELPQSVMVQGGIMEFRGISPSDQGKYACSASNMVGRAEAVAEVIVQDDLVRITWLEAVLYSPEGNIINDPLYTFNFDDESGRESGSGSKADNDEGSGEMDDWDHGNRGGGAQQGSPEYEDLEPERDYPPVEPYESKERYIGVKATEDNEYSYQVGDQFSAREGSSIDLRCRLDTSNGRYLQWSKENGYIPRQAMEMQDGILRIPNVVPSDSGRYICSNGQDRQYVFLTIDSYQGGGGTGGNSGGGGGGGGGSNTNDDSILDPRFGDFPSYPGYPGYPEDRGSSGPYAEPSRGDSGDPYGDDEAYASYPGYGSPSTDPQALTRPKVQCTENEFHCLEREECINIAHVCDGEIDCTDGSDEKNCRNRRSAFTQAEVEIQSNRKKVFEGDDLELRCSLIGDSTGVFGRISWTKLNSYLSSNVQDMGSVLRFTKLQEDNTGVYQCTIYTSQGNIFKQNFELNVEGLGPRSDESMKIIQAEFGSRITLKCGNTLKPPITYGWRKHQGVVPRESAQSPASLTIPRVSSDDAGIYICKANNSEHEVEQLMALVVTQVIPHFPQAPLSYMEMVTLPDAYLNLDLEISFKPELANGIIFYNGHDERGGKDFISFGLKNGKPELRYNLGSDTAILTAPTPIIFGKWHTVKISRSRKNATLVIDDNIPIRGSAEGRFEGLDLMTPLYLGGVPYHINAEKDTDLNNGFKGCIGRFVIGTKEMVMSPSSFKSQGVESCDSCSLEPCENEGICQASANDQGYRCLCLPGFSGENCKREGEMCFEGACNGGRCQNTAKDFECLCPFGQEGRFCEDTVNITRPAFSGNSYLATNRPKHILRQLKMAFKFRALDTRDSVLIYSAQSDDGQGDFMSVTLKDEHLEFRFNTGSGTAIIKSPEPIQAKKWYEVVLNRKLKHGQMLVVGQTPVKAESPGSTRGLNIRTPLYFGGVKREQFTLAPGVGAELGFIGCITDIRSGRHELDLQKTVVDSANIRDCSSTESKCDESPCENGSTCSPGKSKDKYKCLCTEGFKGQNCELMSTQCDHLDPCHNGGRCEGGTEFYKCFCPFGFGGRNCDKKLSMSAETVGFRGDSFIELDWKLLPHFDPTKIETIEIELSTTKAEGLLFYQDGPQTQIKDRDFLAVAIAGGIPRFEFNLGEGSAELKGDKKVNDGKLHRIKFIRKGRKGSIEIDGGDINKGSSKGFTGRLNTDGNIFIGGGIKPSQLTHGRYVYGFRGCLHRLVIQGREIDFLKDPVSSGNLTPCSSTRNLEQVNDVSDPSKHDYEDPYTKALRKEMEEFDEDKYLERMNRVG